MVPSPKWVARENNLDKNGEGEHPADTAQDKGASPDVESDVAAVVADQLLSGVFAVAGRDAGDGWGTGLGAGDGGGWYLGVGCVQFWGAVGDGDRHGVCAVARGTGLPGDGIPERSDVASDSAVGGCGSRDSGTERGGSGVVGFERKLLDLPVYRLLGGPCRESLELYATGDDLDWAMELGFTRFKLTNPIHYREGQEGLNRLEEKVADARDLVGQDAELMLNAVMSYNVEYAVQVAETLRPFQMRWLEEPLIPGDLEGHIALKKAVPWMPIATGEDHHGRIAFRQLVENRCVDVLQPDLKWCGGLTEAVKIYTIGEAAGLQTIPHGGANSPFGQHFAMAMPESLMAEFWLGSDPGVPLVEVRAIPGMAVPESGKLVPSDGPGFGMEILAEWIEPFSRGGGREYYA